MEVCTLALVLTSGMSRGLLGVFREVASEGGEEGLVSPERLARDFESFAPVIVDQVARSLGYNPPDLFGLLYQDAQNQRSRPPILEKVKVALGGDARA